MFFIDDFLKVDSALFYYSHYFSDVIVCIDDIIYNAVIVPFEFRLQ